MKITCEKCGAVYNIPDAKLTKDVSRATCKKCGNKITIRKNAQATPSAMDFEDDDGVVNHNEERTVIATVPEIQAFDSTPPLAVPGAPTPAATPQPVAAASPAPAPVAPAPAARPAEPARPATSNTGKPVAAPAPAPQPAPVAPPAPAPSVGAPAPGLNLTGVPISNVKPIDLGPLPFALIGVSLLGTLLLVPGGTWSATTTSAVGFFVALFAQVGVLVALLGMKRQSRASAGASVGSAVSACIVVFLGLLVFQGKENMTFLGLKAPDVTGLVDDVQGMEGLDWVYEEVEVRDEKTGEVTKVKRKVRKPRSTQTGTGMPGVESIATNDQKGGAAGGLKQGPEAGGQVAGGFKLETDAGEGTGRTATGVPTSNLMAKGPSGAAQVPTAEVNQALTTDRVINTCITKYRDRYQLSGRVVLGVELAPGGKVSRAKFKSIELQETELERCVSDRATQLSFSSYTGATTAKVDVTYIL